MPHSREVRATSHADHDPMLMVALAAGDLAATDRDRAADLTRSCADCSALRDDLVAIARATAVAPPPIVERPRDFRLTPSDAARLRPGGWRAALAAFSRPATGLTRNLGVGLATLGLAGLLIGNVQIQLGGSAASLPAAAGQAADPRAAVAAPESSNGDATTTSTGQPDRTSVGGAPAAAASAAPPAATDTQAFGPVVTDPVGDGNGGAAQPAASGTKEMTIAEGGRDGASAPVGAVGDQERRPLNLLFGAAILIGLLLVVVPAVRRSRDV